MTEADRNPPGSSISDDKLQEVARVVRTIADGKVRQFFGQLGSKDVIWKDANQLVTPADLGIEWELIASLGRILPGGVVSEELGDHEAWQPGKFTWIIDPIDGSVEFFRGSADFATALALWSSDHLEAAWIYAPAKNHMWCAHRGHGWQVNGMKAEDRGRQIQISVTSNQYISPQLQNFVTKLRAVGERFVPCRTVSLAYVALAAGELQAAIYDWDKPWDHAAGVVVCMEAGLQVQHLDGQHYDPRKSWSSPLLIAPPDRWNTLARYSD